MSFPTVTFSEVCSVLSGFAFKSNQFGNKGLPIARIRDVVRGYSETYYDGDFKEEYLLKNGDMLIGMDGDFNLAKWKGGKALLNQRVCKLIPDEEKIEPNYLYYFMPIALMNIWRSTPFVTVKHLSVKQINAIQIPLPPLAVQKQIAAVLEKADTLRSQCQQMEQELNALAQSVFLDMFGDPVANPKGWMRTSLTEHGDFKNGLNFAKSETGVNVKYLGVGDFKSLDQIKDVSSLGTVELNELPQNDYLLDDGDIVFVRSNGNKALVGRCLTIYTEDKVTFSGFCIRYRVNDHKLAPEFLNYLFRTPSIKQALLQGGQGANIQNINQKILSSIPIIFPPTEAQESFVEFLEALRAQRVLAKEKLEKQKSMFNSLMQRAFKGELKLKGVA